MPPAGAALPKVAVIGTGGTISSVGRDSLDLVDYTATGQKYQADELVERFPEVRRVADVTAVRFRAVSSTDIGVAEWLELVRTIHDVAASGDKFDGIVVTHGTATLEETAYFLNLTLKTDIPVVLVGAQRLGDEVVVGCRQRSGRCCGDVLRRALGGRFACRRTRCWWWSR